MRFDDIILEKRDGTARITLNRPKVLNAFTTKTLTEIEAAIEDIRKDDAVRVVVITGAGRAFCTGNDLSTGKEFIENPQARNEFYRILQESLCAIENLGKPVIAMVNGFCLAGGFELLLTCDLAIAAEDAQIGDQHANFGLIPGAGATYKLPRLVGMRRAKEFFMTGNWVNGKEAEIIGLVNKAVPADKLEETVNELAAKLAAERSPLATRLMKNLVNQGIQIKLSAGLDLELVEAVHHYTTSEDFKEGLGAFTEKRKPTFKGR